MPTLFEQDPCFQRHEASLKCLDKNAYDRTKCEEEFEMYRECRRKVNEGIKAARREENRKNDPFAWIFSSKPTQSK
eukprot:jgi/Ulvmu1/8007/UM004_0243.1